MVRVPLAELHPFKGYPALKGIMPRNQPYLVRDEDPSMVQLIARVKARASARACPPGPGGRV